MACSVATQFLGYCKRKYSEKDILETRKRSSLTQSLLFVFNAFFIRFLQKVSSNELHRACSVISLFIFRAVILLTQLSDHQPNETSQKFYISTAIFYVSALTSSNSALRFISYPSQVIAKALKPIPSMIFGCLIGGKSYPLRKYLIVSLVVFGAVIFLYKPNLFASENSVVLGYGLVAFSLLMNGCAAGVQEKMRSVARPSPLNLMMFLNSWSSVLLIVGVGVSGEFQDFVVFCTKYPDVIYSITIICFVGGLGQIFTTTMITSFGVVPCCLVLTVRKFFNVLFSVLYYGHELKLFQWLAIVLIFSSLTADAVLSFKPGKNDKSKSDCLAKSEKFSSEEKIALKIEEEKIMYELV